MSRRIVLLVLPVLVAALLGPGPALATHPSPQGGAPQPPSQLRAAALAGAVSLDWDAPSGATAAVSYTVHRELLGRAPGDGAGVPEVLVAQTVETRFHDRAGLVNGRAYVYSVRATSATGADSGPAQVRVTPATPVPGRPQQAPSLRGRFSDTGEMHLDWTPSSTPVDAFVLHRRNVSRGEQFGADGARTVLSSGTDLSHVDDYPFDTTEDYGFAVQTQVNGVLGPLSAEVRLTQPRGFPPSDPIRLHAQATLQGTVLLTWDTVDHGKEYLVYKEDAPGSRTFTRLVTRTTRTLEARGTLSHEDRAVIAGQTHRYYVLCYGHRVGGQVQSNDAVAVALPRLGVGAPGAPEPRRLVEEVTPAASHMVLHAVPGTDEVEVRWNPVPGAVSYEIQGGPVFGPDGKPSRETYTILADGVVTTSFRHRRDDDEPWEYFGFWLDPAGYAGAPTKYQARNLAYGRRANLPGVLSQAALRTPPDGAASRDAVARTVGASVPAPAVLRVPASAR